MDKGCRGGPELAPLSAQMGRMEHFLGQMGRNWVEMTVKWGKRGEMAEQTKGRPIAPQGGAECVIVSVPYPPQVLAPPFGRLLFAAPAARYRLPLNSIAFSNAPRRDADSQPISQLVRQAVSQAISRASRQANRQTQTCSLGFSTASWPTPLVHPEGDTSSSMETLNFL